MRTSGARLLGLIVVLLGAAGGIAPYAGPRFHFQMGAGAAWQWTTERWQLHAAPGALVVLGGLLLLAAAPRPAARLGAVLALVGGAWFVVGPVLAPIWLGTISEGQVASTTLRQAAHPLGYHYGTGLLIVAAAAYAWAGCAASVRAARVRAVAYPDGAAWATPGAVDGEPEPAAQASTVAIQREDMPGSIDRWWTRGGTGSARRTPPTRLGL